MANDGFNGSTATFASSPLGSGVRAIRYQETGGNSDTTASDDTMHTYEAGVPDIEVTIEFLGTTTVAKNDKGAIAVTLNDGETGPSITNAICTAVSYGGQMDGELTGSATFKPSTAAAT